MSLFNFNRDSTEIVTHLDPHPGNAESFGPHGEELGQDLDIRRAEDLRFEVAGPPQLQNCQKFLTEIHGCCDRLRFDFCIRSFFSDLEI